MAAPIVLFKFAVSQFTSRFTLNFSYLEQFEHLQISIMLDEHQ